MSGQITNKKCSEIEVESKGIKVEDLIEDEEIRNLASEEIPSSGPKGVLINEKRERWYIKIAQEVAKKCNPYPNIIGSEETLSTLSIFQLIIESTFNPMAGYPKTEEEIKIAKENINKALGIAQFTCRAAKEVGLIYNSPNGTVDNRDDALRSIIANRLYMNKNLNKIYKMIDDDKSDDQKVRREAKYKDIFRAALKAYNGGNEFASLDTVYRSTQNMRSDVKTAAQNKSMRKGEEPNQYSDVILNHFLLIDYNDYSLPNYNEYAYYIYANEGYTKSNVSNYVSEEKYNEFKTKALERYGDKQEIFQKILDHYNIDKEKVKSFLDTKVFNNGVVIGIS